MMPLKLGSKDNILDIITACTYNQLLCIYQSSELVKLAGDCNIYMVGPKLGLRQGMILLC